MANIKSSKKRAALAVIRTERNKSVKSRVKTAIKKVETAVAAGDKTLAAGNLQKAISELGKAASKGILHKNASAHKVSSLTRSVNALS